MRWKLSRDEHCRRATAYGPSLAPRDGRERLEQQHDVRHDLGQRLGRLPRLLGRWRDRRHRLRLF